MRIWDITVECLCRQHLLGEHREVHGLWNILTKHDGKGGYSVHPETKRWVGKLAALYQRHQQLEKEIETRGYQHRSTLDKSLAKDSEIQDVYINSLDEQREILQGKDCDCPLK